MPPSKQYLERVRYAEFHILLDTHPICNEFINFDKVLRPKASKHYRYNIDHLALAQHYGICTDLIDLTADKWVAAFFAATDYKNGEYVVHTDTTEKGVFYSCLEPNYDQLNEDSIEPIIRPIGIQPFTRPGEQRGLAYPMAPIEDFEDKAKIMTFVHNPKINELIFNFTNRSKRLFPEDVLKDKAKIITRSLIFSEAAYEKAQNMFYSNISKEQIKEWEKAENMHHQQEPITSFTEKDMIEFRRKYPAFERDLLKNIIFS